MGSVVVPLDESTLAEGAIPWAAMLARAQGLPVQLVSVEPPADASWEFTDVDPREPLKAHRGTLTGYLEQLRRHDALADVPVTAVVLDGDVATQLRWLINRTEGAFVVITTRGLAGFGLRTVGSVADRLVRTLPVPVVVVPPEVPVVAVGALLVPLDGSPEAEQVLPLARKLALGLGATLHLVRAVDPDLAWGFPDEAGTALLAAARSHADSYLARVAASGEVTAVCDGTAVDAILGYAGEHG